MKSATHKRQPGVKAAEDCRNPRRFATLWQALKSEIRASCCVALVSAFLIPIARGWAEPAAEGALAAAALKAFEQARVRSQSEPRSVEAGWQLGRACFDWAEFATNNAQRAELAQEGIAACQRALAQASNSAPVHYYLGLDLGQLARTKGLGALKLIGQMEAEWSTARGLDERLDYGGPDRSLGLLYRDAPSIASVGSRTKARQHLQRALELAPDFPENRLNSIESELKWGEPKNALRDLKLLEAGWPAARTNFPATDWAANWADWEKRLQTLKKTLEEPSKVLESPRGKGG